MRIMHLKKLKNNKWIQKYFDTSKPREGREEGKVLYSRMPANIEKLTEFKNHYFVLTVITYG